MTGQRDTAYVHRSILADLRPDDESHDGGEDSLPARHDDPIRVIVIDARVLIRECVSRCLEDALGPGSVLTFSSLCEWQDSTEDQPPATLVLLCMDRRNNLDAQTERKLSQLAARGGLPPMVMLSEGEDASDILNALDSGIKGYIPTSVSHKVAIEALHLIRAGGVFIPASSLMSARKALTSTSATDKLRATGLFTERQAAVVEALRHGKANKIIAYELNMQESTVKVHVRNIMKKLKAHNRTQVAYMTQNMFNG